MPPNEEPSHLKKLSLISRKTRSSGVWTDDIGGSPSSSVALTSACACNNAVFSNSPTGLVAFLPALWGLTAPFFSKPTFSIPLTFGKKSAADSLGRVGLKENRGHISVLPVASCGQGQYPRDVRLV